MDHFIAAFIGLAPFFAMAPLALGAVAIVALLVSPALRSAVGDWARRRLGTGRPAGQTAGQAAPAANAAAVEALSATVARLEDRIGLLERVVVSLSGPSPRRDLLAPADRAGEDSSPTTPVR